MSSPDILGLVLEEGLRRLDKHGIEYELKEIPPAGTGEKLTARVIRQRTIQGGTKTELLIAYF